MPQKQADTPLSRKKKAFCLPLLRQNMPVSDIIATARAASLNVHPADLRHMRKSAGLPPGRPGGRRRSQVGATIIDYSKGPAPAAPARHPSPLKSLVCQIHAVITTMGMRSITIKADGTVETHMDLDVT